MRYKPIVFVFVCWTVVVTLAQEYVYEVTPNPDEKKNESDPQPDTKPPPHPPTPPPPPPEEDISEEEAENEDNSPKDNYTFVALIDIVFTDGCKRTCTGAIIHDNVVITAAHCFTMIRNAFLLPELTMSFVVIGTKLMFETGYEQYLPIERVVTHPRYKGWTADLALVFTFANMMSDKPGQILPLAIESSTTPVDSNVTVLSWGKCKADLDYEEIEKPKQKKKKQANSDQMHDTTKAVLYSQEPDDTKPKKKKQADSDQISEVTKGVPESQEPDDTEEPTRIKRKNHRDRRTWVREKPVQDKNIERAEHYRVQYKLQQDIPSMNTANQDNFQQPNLRAHKDDEVLGNPQRQVFRQDNFQQPNVRAHKDDEVLRNPQRQVVRQNNFQQPNVRAHKDDEVLGNPQRQVVRQDNFQQPNVRAHEDHKVLGNPQRQVVRQDNFQQPNVRVHKGDEVLGNPQRQVVRPDNFQQPNVRAHEDHKVLGNPQRQVVRQDNFQQPNVRVHKDDEVLGNPQRQVVRQDNFQQPNVRVHKDDEVLGNPQRQVVKPDNFQQPNVRAHEDDKVLGNPQRQVARQNNFQQPNVRPHEDDEVLGNPQQQVVRQDNFQQPDVRAHEDDEVQGNPQRQVVRQDKNRYIAPLNKKQADYVNSKARTVLTNLTNNNKKSKPYLDYVENFNEDLTRNWDGKKNPTMKHYAQTIQRKRLVKNLNFNGPDGGGYSPIENHNNRMKQQRNYNTGQIHQNNNNQNRGPVRNNRRSLPLLQEYHRFQHFKNWRRQIGQEHNNLTVGMFGYVNLATCKKIVDRSLPPLYEITNTHEVLCYSSEEFYITNEDSGAPVVQGDELVAITIGGVEADGDHVAVGMRIACFCKWIAKNLPNYGGDYITCCKDCCTDQQPPFRSKNNKERRVNYHLPSSRLRPRKGSRQIRDLYRFVSNDDDENDGRTDAPN